MAKAFQALLYALIAAIGPAAAQGTTTNVNIGTTPGARATHGPQSVTIKQRDGGGPAQRQIGKPKFEDVSVKGKSR
jgi:hypothetical protein